MVVPNRFIFKNFTQKKLNALIKMPEELNLSEFLHKNSKQAGDLLVEEKKKKYD